MLGTGWEDREAQGDIVECVCRADSQRTGLCDNGTSLPGNATRLVMESLLDQNCPNPTIESPPSFCIGSETSFEMHEVQRLPGWPWLVF